ncbi:MAG: AAA family ATPase [Marinosulfonomonas sp.]|nr:AAA family ATPase [Marinosulfonomonas sp.]
MLKSLEIKRFKSIRSLKLDLGRVNLFIGGNGSGKSNILEALGLLSACIDQGLRGRDLERKGMRLSPPELMKSAHKNADLPKIFGLSAEFDNGISYKCNLTSRERDPLLRFHSESSEFEGKRQFGRSGAGNKVLGESIFTELDKYRGMWDQVKVAYPFDKLVEKTFSEFGRYAIYTPQTDFLRGKRGGAVDVPPIGLHGEGLPEAALSVIISSNTAKDSAKRDFDTRAIDLVFLPKWANQVRVGKIKKALISQDIADPSEEMVFFKDKFMREGRNTLSAYDSSEGTLFLLFVAILIAHKDAPRYFALDNVDNALNPALTRKLVELMIELIDEVHANDYSFGPKQVFLTSHNPTSLDAFDLFNPDHRVFVVSRNEKGHTLADRLEPSKGMTPEEWTIAKEGKNLSQLWLDGMIAGANGSEGI